MTLVVVDQGEAAFLTLITDVDMTLRLYRNDATAGLTQAQVDALDESDFTEATFAGYAASSMTTAWTVTEGNPTTATRAEVSFTRSSTGTAELIYGYYVTRNSDGALMWFEDFDGPITVEFINDRIDVTPTITLDDPEGNAVEVASTKIWPYSTPPSGWLLCQGQAVSRTTYPQLHALAAADSYPHGNGDGSTTFNLPDLRQRFPLGKATSGTGGTLGDTGGAIDHAHDLNTSSSHAKIFIGSAPDIGMVRKTVASYNSTHQNVAAAGDGLADVDPFTLGTELGGSSDSENPPFLTVNFIIKAG